MSDTKPKWAEEIGGLVGGHHRDRPMGMLTTPEVAVAAGMHAASIGRWVRAFGIKPHAVGREGRYGTHYWNPERLLEQLREGFEKRRKR